MEFNCKLEDLNKPIEHLRELLSEYIQNPSSHLAPIILLNGEMGSGKTTFTRHFIQSFQEDLIVNSPTFNIFNRYKVGDMLFFHFDLYRIKTLDEVYDMGFEEIWGFQGISMIEWWSKARGFFREDSIFIDIKWIDEETRKYKINRLIELEKTSLL
jgi:tRNA threonylcarbamoyladenosine biosynthesis protein TsaE